MCIANICTETHFINNFYNLVEMNFRQRGLELLIFPACFIQNQQNQVFLPSFWSNARVILKLCIFHLSVILVLFSLSNERGIKMWTMSKTFIMLTDLTKSISITDWVLTMLFAGTIFDKASWQPLRVSTLNHLFSWCLVRDKRNQIKLSTCEEFLAQY